MAEENQAQQVMKEPQRVTTKDPKKVEAGKMLAAISHKKREAKKREEAQNGRMNQYYGTGVVLTVEVVGGLVYYIYQTKRGEAPSQLQPPQTPQQLSPKANKFEMD